MYSHRFRICETTTGAPVNPRDLAIAALAGHIRRITIDPTGRITNLGRRQRLFTGAAREAILLMGPQCTYPGCNRTIGLHIDHLQEWARNNGTTDITNGGPTCPQHNNAKHTNTTTVTRDETGWHHHRTDGTEIAPRWSG